MHDCPVEDPLRQVTVDHAPRRALVDRGSGISASWFNLDDLATTWAKRLTREGVKAGNRVAVQEPAGLRFAALLHACLRIGAALVPISPRAPRPEVERMLTDCQPRLLVEDGEVRRLANSAVGDPADLCLLYTSGSSGRAKIVRQTLANHLASAHGCQQMLGSDERDRWLLMLAPHHVGGLAIFMRSVICNQPVITLPRFEPAAILSAIEQERPTLMSAVPVMLDRLLEAGGMGLLQQLKAILIGGAPATAIKVAEWIQLGLNVCPSYGLTESCSQVAVVPPGRAAKLAGSSGLICPHAEVGIEQLPGREPKVGEIIINGPSLSPGYLDPELPSIGTSGGFRSGDVGHLDAGALKVLGRLDNVIITGGEKVQPEEIEAVLQTHPKVLDAAVTGEPDPEWGEIVCAWVMAPDLLPTELEAWCRERLLPAKLPRRWQLVDRLPRGE
ncbi:MAG: class I adenylate-forming enzyme family protein [Candidatus Dormibacteraceae bacterium]